MICAIISLGEGDNLARKKSNGKAKKRIFLFFVFFGTVIASLSYSFFSNINKMVGMSEKKTELKNKLTSLKEEEGKIVFVERKVNLNSQINKEAIFYVKKNGVFIDKVLGYDIYRLGDEVWNF